MELVAGLRIALETPNATERWLAGEAIFAGEQAPMEDAETLEALA